MKFFYIKHLATGLYIGGKTDGVSLLTEKPTMYDAKVNLSTFKPVYFFPRSIQEKYGRKISATPEDFVILSVEVDIQ
jgi:hypothetical protein